MNSTSGYFSNIWRTDAVSISDAVRLFRMLPGCPRTPADPGQSNRRRKRVIPEEACKKEVLQLINGPIKLTSNRNRDLPATIMYDLYVERSPSMLA